MMTGLLRLRSVFDFAGDRASAARPDALVERLQRGDLAALGEAYEQHHERVRAFTRRLVGDPAAAEDLVQEVFLALPGAIKRFRGESTLATFLVSIAVNHARHHVRAAARRRDLISQLALESPARVGDPEHGASERQLADALFRALDALPIDQRVAFVLCEMEERTSAEAAKIAGTSDNTMRARLFHARKKLREALEAEGVR